MAAPTLHREASATHRLEVRAEELECELTAERAEAREFATAVLGHAWNAHNALLGNKWESVEQSVAAVIAAAERRRKQASGGPA